MPPIDAEDTLDDEMCAPVVNEATGKVRVLAERCATCTFRPENPFRATIPGPVRDR
ncbi:hypothetical protein [Streptomyces sp. NPDC047043]|uniref:hypothetical protein n=1 Tax=Streptomyces sp. NPDC047043 TaxID=3154497 RepID=UPI0033CCBD73